jgi:golgi-specific brefeldin A-resistance guanine nucleotide exchange factor 1
VDTLEPLGQKQRYVEPQLLMDNEANQITAWTTYWSPIFQTLTTQSLNPCRAIRSAALTSLQRCLLSPTLTSMPLDPSKDGAEYVLVFNDVLFPLISQLLKPEVYQTDPSGMGETRVQTAGLIGRVFLHFLEKVGPDFDDGATLTAPMSSTQGSEKSQSDAGSQQPQEDLTTVFSIWTRILSILERLMTSSGPSSGDNLEEAIPESLKNILLVMSSDGYLVPPEQNEARRPIWNETWRRLDRFLPGLMGGARAGKALD